MAWPHKVAHAACHADHVRSGNLENLTYRCRLFLPGAALHIIAGPQADGNQEIRPGCFSYFFNNPNMQTGPAGQIRSRVISNPFIC